MAKAKGGLKPEDIKRLYFWIVLPIILVLSLVFAFVANSKIKKQYKEKTDALTAAKKGVDDVVSNKKHPNDTTIKAIKGETKTLSSNVFDSWMLMYGDQKMRNRWPRQLSREFLDLVENKLKFRDPIGVGKPYLLEDYGFFIGNHLPDLLRSMNRRRCQVKEYKLLKKAEMTNLGITGLKEQFWPVYVSHDDEGNEFAYIAVYSDPENPKSPIKDVYLYDVKKDLASLIDDSGLRDRLKAVEEPEPYWRDVDPWIMDPKDYIAFGVADSDLQGVLTAIAAVASGGSASAMGGSGGSGGMGGMSMMGGSGGMGGSGMGGSGSGMGGSGSGGSRGSMGGDSMGGGLSGLGIGAVPGDGYDPAEDQISGTELEEQLGGGTGVTGGRGMGNRGMTAGGSGGASRGTGMTGGRGMATGGSGMGGGRGGSGMGGSGMGGTTTEDPTWSQQIYPGLPPYKERRRIVGNVDWPDPEIYYLPTWQSDATPTSIEVWYAQETLWVYEALISVIAETNSASEEYKDNISKAPIKCVEAMLIGQKAAVDFTTLSQTIGDLTGASANANSLGGSMSGDMTSSSSSGGMGSEMTLLSGSAENQALTKIVLGRYVDADDIPLKADDKPPFAEFNKMPVCLKVAIDQRKIPELLASCANCSMPIDVKHIRICPDNNEPFVMPIPLENMASGDGSGMGGMMGGMMGGSGMGMMGGSGMGGSGMGGSGSGMGGSGSGGRGGRGGRGSMTGDSMMGGSTTGGIEVGRSDLSQSEYGADCIRVEVYGIINIFNEPNKETFATGASAEDADAEMESIIENAHESGETVEGGESADEGSEATESDADATQTSTTPAEATPTEVPMEATGSENAPAEAPADVSNAASAT